MHTLHARPRKGVWGISGPAGLALGAVKAAGTHDDAAWAALEMLMAGAERQRVSSTRYLVATWESIQQIAGDRWRSHLLRRGRRRLGDGDFDGARQPLQHAMMRLEHTEQRGGLCNRLRGYTLYLGYKIRFCSLL